jgi:hypothetical protein
VALAIDVALKVGEAPCSQAASMTSPVCALIAMARSSMQQKTRVALGTRIMRRGCVVAHRIEAKTTEPMRLPIDFMLTARRLLGINEGGL